MTSTINQFWSALEKAVRYYKGLDHNIHFDSSKKDVFFETVTERYNSIKDCYMIPEIVDEEKEDSEKRNHLDRHKVAAIFIVVAIENRLISYSADIPDGKKFMGCEMFVTEVAWNWMVGELDDALQKAGSDQHIDDLVLPIAFACPTTYFDIFCRELYYANEKGKLFELDIAENLFLLEYITLLRKNIDPNILCLYKDKDNKE